MDAMCQAGVIRGPTNNLALKVLAGTAPVVTLIGRTGVGKTFLAQRIGKRRVFDYLEGGEWWKNIPSAVDAGERVVVCIDVAPQHSLELSEAIVSRLVSGPVARIGDFTGAMKLELLTGKKVPDFARGILLRSIRGGIRELNGAIQLIQEAEPQPKNALDVMRLISPFADIHTGQTFEDVVKAVCLVYNLTPEALGARTKNRHVCDARKALWWTCSKVCPSMTRVDMARETGRLDSRAGLNHSTVVLGIQQAEKRGLTKSERFSKVLSFLGEDANDYW